MLKVVLEFFCICATVLWTLLVILLVITDLGDGHVQTGLSLKTGS